MSPFRNSLGLQTTRKSQGCNVLSSLSSSNLTYNGVPAWDKFFTNNESPSSCSNKWIFAFIYFIYFIYCFLVNSSLIKFNVLIDGTHAIHSLIIHSTSNLRSSY